MIVVRSSPVWRGLSRDICREEGTNDGLRHTEPDSGHVYTDRFFFEMDPGGVQKEHMYVHVGYAICH